MNKNVRRLLTRLEKLGNRDGRGDTPGRDKAAREEIDAYAAKLAKPAIDGLRGCRDPEQRLIRAVSLIRQVTLEVSARTARRNVALAIACKPVSEGGDGMKKARAARRVARTRGFVHREAYGHTALESVADVTRVRERYGEEFGRSVTPIRVAQIEEAHIRHIEAIRYGAVGVRVQTVRELASARPGRPGTVSPYSVTEIAALAGMESSQVAYDLYKAGKGSRQRRYDDSEVRTTAQADALRSVGDDGRMSNRGSGRVHLNTLKALVRAGRARVLKEITVEVPVPGRTGKTRSVIEYVVTLTDEGWAARSKLRADAVDPPRPSG
ncbi:hypothetical protein [Actinomadura sp. 6K520]|uniref:hypothetical protein n=1 Tax=Actinomadura sp. 6K520 TaxID=2530364 RepID=UPI0010481707|nr:hypothetical protein [Actinomadura sp. 6K520]TDE38188.1 hypothetical protein E1289_03150 [Actinomadura sp. 6K520]